MPKPATSRWDTVEWTRPVREIAAALHVSRQRVYQVMVARGVPRGARGVRRARLLRLDTARLTAAEAAARAGCSVEYARAVLRAAGRPYRPADPAGVRRYAAFTAWLREQQTYTVSTIRSLCAHCRRVERIHDLRLDRVLGRPGGLARLYRRLAAAAPRCPRRNDQWAVRRYADFLRARGR